MRRDPEGDQALLHLPGIGEPQVLGRRDVAEVVGPCPGRYACAHAACQVIMADGDVRGEGTRDEEGRGRGLLVSSHGLGYQVSADMPAHPLNDHLDAPFPGLFREDGIQDHLPLLRIIHLIMDTPAPHRVPEGEDDVMPLQDREHLMEMLEKGILGPGLYHVRAGDGTPL